MAERLHLIRTLGESGWQAVKGEGESFVLAAIGSVLLRPGALALRALLRLAQLWHTGIDRQALLRLRLALCLDRRIELDGLNLHVGLTPPTRSRHALRFDVDLDILQRHHRSLPAPPDDCAWLVLRLSAGGPATLLAMAAALAEAPRGTRLRLQIAARVSRAPDTLRAGFPLRADALLDADEGWLPLIHATRFDIDRARP